VYWIGPLASSVRGRGSGGATNGYVMSVVMGDGTRVGE